MSCHTSVTSYFLQVFTDNEERQGEKRIAAALFCNRHDFLLTGSSVLDVWPLTRTIQDTMSVPQTHDRGLSQVTSQKVIRRQFVGCMFRSRYNLFLLDLV